MTRRTRRNSGAAVAKPLLNARRALHLTQAGLGAAIGLDARTVQRWERGFSGPTRANLTRLLAYIETLDADIAATLTHEVTGQARPAPPVPSPDVLMGAVLAAADELDVPARRFREALTRLLGRLHEERFSVEQAVGVLSSREGGA